MSIAVAQTPIGPLGVVEEDGAIIRLLWNAEAMGDRTPLLDNACRQIGEYFDGARQVFDLPVRVQGSDFQRAVCAAIAAIPFGETRTYGDLSKVLSMPAQAVGSACGGNPIPVIIPCHRVLGANSLGGYSGAGGVEMKVRLLRP